MKKIYLGITVFALATILALPVFADGRHHRSSDELEVENENSAVILNFVRTASNTGMNEVNRNRGEGRVETGNAQSDALVSTQANSNEVGIRCSSCLRGIDEIEVENENRAFVLNAVSTVSNTGMNEVNVRVRSHHHHHDSDSGGEIVTGNALSIATVTTMVNSNVVRVR